MTCRPTTATPRFDCYRHNQPINHSSPSFSIIRHSFTVSVLMKHYVETLCICIIIIL